MGPGMICCSLMVALFNEPMSTQILNLFSLVGWGTATIGETQVRPKGLELLVVVKSSRLSAKTATHLVSIGWLLCLYIPGVAAYLDNSAFYFKAF